MARPRILLVPQFSEIEWAIRPEIEKWADVGSYDAPGVGDEPPPDSADIQALVARGLEEVDRLGWERFVVACDEHGAFTAIPLATERAEAVAGIAFGHACLSYRTRGERAPINGEVIGAFTRMAELDYRAYARAMTQLTQSAYGDEMAEEFIRRVPQQLTIAYMSSIMATYREMHLEPMLRRLDCPLLLAKHEGCLAWTDESFEDVTAAFPDAETLVSTEKPSVSPKFAESLREFCAGLDWD